MLNKIFIIYEKIKTTSKHDHKNIVKPYHKNHRNKKYKKIISCKTFLLYEAVIISNINQIDKMLFILRFFVAIYQIMIKPKILYDTRISNQNIEHSNGIKQIYRHNNILMT